MCAMCDEARRLIPIFEGLVGPAEIEALREKTWKESPREAQTADRIIDAIKGLGGSVNSIFLAYILSNMLVEVCLDHDLPLEALAQSMTTRYASRFIAKQLTGVDPHKKS